MKKVIFYEEEGGWLHKCMFAGLDNKGKAQWIVMEPGNPTQTLDELEMNLCIGDICFNLLCEEGDTIPSADIARVMAACLHTSPGFLENRLEKQVVALNKFGLKWNSQPLKFAAYVFKNQKGNFTLSLCIDCEVEMEDILWDCHFDSIEGVMDCLSTFFSYMSCALNIHFSASLEIPQKEWGEVSKKHQEIFENITII